MAEIVERVDALEEALMKLAYAQFNTEMELQKLSKEMTAFKGEMTDSKDERQDPKDEMKNFREENRRANREMNRYWGKLADKMGTMAEDLVAPNLPRIVKEVLNQDIFDLTMRRRQKLADGRSRELDALTVTADTVCLTSTQSTLRSADVDRFADDVQAFRAFFPEYAIYPIVGILASLSVDASVLSYVEGQGLLVLGVGDEIMEVKNSPGFIPKKL